MSGEAGRGPAQLCGKCTVTEKVPGKCSSPSPGEWRFLPGNALSGKPRVGEDLPPERCRGCRGTRQTGPPSKLEPLLRAVEAAPRTFLLRNSLTREAATSSTKRVSMLSALPTRPRPRSPRPQIRWPVWPCCLGDGVISAGRTPPLPWEPEGGKAGGKGRSVL